jgi:hypothetical protein
MERNTLQIRDEQEDLNQPEYPFYALRTADRYVFLRLIVGQATPQSLTPQNEENSCNSGWRAQKAQTGEKVLWHFHY